MTKKHTLLILFVMFLLGSAYPTAKLGLNASIPPILFGSIRMAMFYLYKFYPVGQVLPFYALFPVFGIILSFFIFGEIPTLIMVIGGIIVITSVFLLQKIR